MVYRPYDPRIDGDDAYGAPHYAAYVMRKSGAPRGVNLGPASAIDDAVKSLREALRDPKQRDVATRARAVAEQVFQPLRPYLGGAIRLLISPDGDLNLVPFEALVDEDGSYLVERYAMSYLTSGRDLLRMRVKRGNGNPPLVIADPLFGEPPTARSGTGNGKALSTIYFAPLPASVAEARAIKALFRDARVLTGRERDEIRSPSGRAATHAARRVARILVA